MTYDVEIGFTVSGTYTVVIEAENDEEAKELAKAEAAGLKLSDITNWSLEELHCADLLGLSHRPEEPAL